MILDSIKRNRRIFDPTNTTDKEVFAKFEQTGAWGSEGCPFELEFPYESIPCMIREKLICL